MDLTAHLLQLHLDSHHRIRPTPSQQEPPIHFPLSRKLSEIKFDRPKKQPVLFDTLRRRSHRVRDGLLHAFRNMLDLFLHILLQALLHGRPIVNRRGVHRPDLINDQPETRLRVLSITQDRRHLFLRTGIRRGRTRMHRCSGDRSTHGDLDGMSDRMGPLTRVLPQSTGLGHAFAMMTLILVVRRLVVRLAGSRLRSTQT